MTWTPIRHAVRDALNAAYYAVCHPRYFFVERRRARDYYRRLQAELESKAELRERLASYVSATWREQLEALAFQKGIPSTFLHLPTASRMFYKGAQMMSEYRRFLKREKLSEKTLPELTGFREPPFGTRFGLHAKVSLLSLRNVSPNTAAMAYDLLNIRTMLKGNSRPAVLEFGGGYGSLCNLVMDLTRHEATYIIVDLPETLALQHLFLSTVLGPDRVVALDGNGLRQPVHGRVHLVPVYAMDRILATVDLLVSTFALTESTLLCQQLAADRDFFDASNVYLVGHDPPDSAPEETKWDSMRATEARIRERFSTVVRGTFPMENCYQLRATR